MITTEQINQLHRAAMRVPINGRQSNLADMLDSLFAIHCELSDMEDIYQAAEDLVQQASDIRDDPEAGCT